MAQGWYYSPDHGQLCQVIEVQTLWGATTCRVWLPWRKRNIKRLRGSRIEATCLGLENAWQEGGSHEQLA
ncbi:MAG: hypothetical protein Q7I93_00250 [Syntrophales bacterium]|nr:hypothetical protein [Syntrophales bacterium]